MFTQRQTSRIPEPTCHSPYILHTPIINRINADRTVLVVMFFSIIPHLSLSTKNIKRSHFFPELWSQPVHLSFPFVSINLFRRRYSWHVSVCPSVFSVCKLHKTYCLNTVVSAGVTESFQILEFPSTSAFRAKENYLKAYSICRCWWWHTGIRANHTDVNTELTSVVAGGART